MNKSFALIFSLCLFCYLGIVIKAQGYDYPITDSAISKYLKDIGSPSIGLYRECLGRNPTDKEISDYVIAKVNGVSDNKQRMKICESDVAIQYKTKLEQEAVAKANTNKPSNVVSLTSGLVKDINGNIINLATSPQGLVTGALVSNPLTAPVVAKTIGAKIGIDVAKDVLGFTKETAKLGIEQTKDTVKTGVDVAKGIADGILVQNLEGAKDQVIGTLKDIKGVAEEKSLKSVVNLAVNPVVRVAETVKNVVEKAIVNPAKAVANYVANTVSRIFGFGGRDSGPKYSTEDAQAMVRQIYREELGRDVDSSGLAEWTKVIQYGNGPEWAREQIKNSAEGQKRNGGKSSTQVSNSVPRGGSSCGQLLKSQGYSKGECGVNPGGYTNLGNTYDCQPCYGHKQVRIPMR